MFNTENMIKECIDEPSLVFKYIRNGYYDIVDKLIDNNMINVNLVDCVGNDVVTRLLKARQYNFAISVENNSEIKLTEHDAYKWQSMQEAIDNPKITDEVKECLEIYNFNNRKEDKEYECHFCATACVVNKEKNKILFIHHKKLSVN